MMVVAAGGVANRPARPPEWAGAGHWDMTPEEAQKQGINIRERRWARRDAQAGVRPVG